MPHTPSAKKSLRQNKRRRAHNVEALKDIKIQVKEFLRVVKSGDKANMQKQYSICAKKLDKAGSRRVIHPNQVARKKSQLARIMNSQNATPQAGQT